MEPAAARMVAAQHSADPLRRDVVERSLSGGNVTLASSALSAMIRLADTDVLERPFAQSSIVYSCVQSIVRAAAQVPIRLWRDIERTVEAENNDPLFQLLLLRPNPLMSGEKLIRASVMFMQLAGGVFYLLTSTRGGRMGPIEPGQEPDEIWPVREDLLHLELDPDTQMPREWYFYSANGSKVSYPAHAVAHVYEIDPSNPFRGIGPLQAAFRRVNVSFRAEAFDDALVSYGGQIGGIFSHEERRLGPDQIRALNDSLQQNVDNPAKSGQKIVLPGGVKFTPTAFSPRDMEAKELRLSARDDIMAVFGCTKPVLGITDDVNRANSREARRVFYENKMVPELNFLASEIRSELFSRVAAWEDYELEFDHERAPAMSEDMDSQIERARKLMEMGRSFEEAATIIGWDIDLDEVEDTERRFVPSTWVPVDLAGASFEDEPEDDDEPLPPEIEEESIRTAAHDQRRAIAAAFEKSVQRHERQVARSTYRVFSLYVQAHIKRLRDLAAVRGGDVARVAAWPCEAWTWDRRPAHRQAMALWELVMDCAPDREHVTMRGISPSELDAIVLGAEIEWGRKLWEAVDSPLKRAVLESASEVATQMGSVAIDATHPAVVRWMAKKEILIVEGPMSVVADRIRSVLVRGLADAPSVGTLADRVRSVLEKLERDLRQLKIDLGTRATMIARTESASAANHGRVEQFRQSGVVQHEWISSRDEVVREGHRIDGEVVPIGERFSNGLVEPGEAGAPANMVINCRCTVAPVIERQA